MQLHEKIPNNVNLHDNRRLQRALEKWQPNYMKWWRDAGPADWQADLTASDTAELTNYLLKGVSLDS